MTDDKTVVGRAVAIIEAVADARDPVALATLTRRTGIPKPTVRRIANDLARRGVLELTQDGYRAGTLLIYHGLRAAQQHGFVLTAQPYIQDLYLRTRGEIVWCASLYGGELTLNGSAFGRNYAAVMKRQNWPSLASFGPSIVLTAAGRLQIAAHEEQAEHILAMGWAPLTQYSVTDPRKLRALLDEARDTGFVHEREQSAVGWSCVASAVRDGSGTLIGAIGVTGRSAVLEQRSLHTGLVRSVQSLQHELREDSSVGLPPGKPMKSFGEIFGQSPRWTPNLAPLLDMPSD
ncbi:IclR family transcriptional regulator C-terminal domain-containing protein [Nocardia sp. NPDC052112]|uniref:IclR family transcriptional regulator n=1 Tax=Nocardia sp. NPDC052112 TaxID=3155646 RepID=UPI00343CB56F